MEEGVGAPRTCTHIHSRLFHCPKVLKVLTKVSEDTFSHKDSCRPPWLAEEAAEPQEEEAC